MNNKTPSLSIIMPVYNVERYLREAVDSVIAQTFTDWELILIDDGSPDNCPAICDSYAAADPRIRVIHQANGGLSAARNSGLEISEGRVIGFVDSDDRIDSRMYEKMIAAMTKHNADMVLCGYCFEWRNRTKIKQPMPCASVLSHDEAMRELFENRAIESYSWDKIYRREIISSLYPVGRNYEDLAVMHRWMNNTSRLAVVDEPLYHYRMRKSGFVYTPSVQTRIDKLNADLERIKYYHTLKISGLDWQKIDASAVKSAVGCAKHIARYCSKKDAYAAFKQIIAATTEFYDRIKDTGVLNARTEKRYQRLLSSPCLFRLSMRIGIMFQPARLKKAQGLFP